MIENFGKDKKVKPRKQQLVRFLIMGGFFIGFAVVFSVLLDTACIIKYLTGVPCPSCGITRAHLEFFRLNFSGAFMMHPLFFYSLIAVCLGIWTFFKPEIAKSKVFNIFIGALVLVFIAAYITRMILFYPHTAPMDHKDDSLFGVIFS